MQHQVHGQRYSPRGEKRRRPNLSLHGPFTQLGRSWLCCHFFCSRGLHQSSPEKHVFNINSKNIYADINKHRAQQDLWKGLSKSSKPTQRQLLDAQHQLLTRGQAAISPLLSPSLSPHGMTCSTSPTTCITKPAASALTALCIRSTASHSLPLLGMELFQTPRARTAILAERDSQTEISALSKQGNNAGADLCTLIRRSQ